MSNLNPKVQLLLSAAVLIAVLVAMWATSDDAGSPKAPASTSPTSVSPD